MGLQRGETYLYNSLPPWIRNTSDPANYTLGGKVKMYSRPGSRARKLRYSCLLLLAALPQGQNTAVHLGLVWLKRCKFQIRPDRRIDKQNYGVFT